MAFPTPQSSFQQPPREDLPLAVDLRLPGRRWARSLWLLAWLATSPATAQGAGPSDVYQVKASITPCLNLREFPSTGAAIVDCLPPGARVVEVYAISGWTKAVNSDGVEGWLATTYLSPVGKAPRPPAGAPLPGAGSPEGPRGPVAEASGGSTFRISATAEPCLKLRRRPVSGESLECLPPGTRVEALETREGWVRGRLDGGREGWVSGGYLESGASAVGGTLAAAPEKPAAAPAREWQAPATGTIVARRVAAPPVEPFSPAATRALEELRDQLGDVTRERDLLAANLRRTKEKLEEARRGPLAPQGEGLPAAGAELTASEDRRRRLEASLEAAAGQEEELTRELTRLREDSKTKDRALAALKRRFEDAEEMRSASRAELARCEARIAGEEAELARQKRRIEGLNAEMLECAAEREELWKVQDRMAASATARPEEGPAEVVEPLSARPGAPVVAASAGESPPPDIELAIDSLFTWAEAWSQQRADDYLAFYSDDFQPPADRSREQWQQERRGRIESPSFIDLSLSAVQAIFLDPRRVSIRFHQRYRSDAYEDAVVKVVVLGWEGDSWRILQETIDRPLAPP